MSVVNGAVENGVVNYAGLQGMVIQNGENGNSEVWFGIDLGAVLTVESVAVLQQAVQERIEAGKKPAGVLSKAVNRIFMHRAQVQDALSTLFSTHSNMVTPGASRERAVWRARYAMLDGMSNKILKMYAADLLPDEVDNYILSDAADRVSLISKLATILAEDKEAEETEDTAVSVAE
jgi:hypothetical protein